MQNLPEQEKQTWHGCFHFFGQYGKTLETLFGSSSTLIKFTKAWLDYNHKLPRVVIDQFYDTLYFNNMEAMCFYNCTHPTSITLLLLGQPVPSHTPAGNKRGGYLPPGSSDNLLPSRHQHALQEWHLCSIWYTMWISGNGLEIQEWVLYNRTTLRVYLWKLLNGILLALF